MKPTKEIIYSSIAFENSYHSNKLRGYSECGLELNTKEDKFAQCLADLALH